MKTVRDHRPHTSATPRPAAAAESRLGVGAALASTLRRCVSLEALGEIRFAIAPAAGSAVTAGYLFDVPVRFAEDRIEVNRATFLAGEAPSVPLIEIREG